MHPTRGTFSALHSRIMDGLSTVASSAVCLALIASPTWAAEENASYTEQASGTGVAPHEHSVEVRGFMTGQTWRMAAVGDDPASKDADASNGVTPKKKLSVRKTPSAQQSLERARRIQDYGRASSKQERFKLSAVDRVHLRVPGNDALSGEYNLSADYTISVPGVGRIDIADLSPRGFERLLSSKLSRLMRREVNVSMTVLRYKPFYMTGLIDRPGAFDWRPGLTLIQAVAVAGGVSRGTDGRGSGSSTPERELVIRQTQQRLGFDLARLARFTAERDGLGSIEATGLLDRFIKSRADSEIVGLADFIKRQNDMLKERSDINASRLGDLQRSTVSAKQELRFALERENAVGEQVAISRKLASSMEQLRKKRLAPNSLYLARRSAVISNEVELTQIKHLVAQARIRLERAEQELDVFRRDRRANLNEQIETIETQVAQHRLLLGEDADDGHNGLGGRKQLSYYIARKSEHGVETIVASLFTEVSPGDVVIISNSPTHRQPLMISDANRERNQAARGRQLDIHEQQMQQIMEDSVAVRSARDPDRRR